MDKHIAKQLLQVRRALREKYRSLKSDIAMSQSHLEKAYQPITQPLRELISTIKKTETFVPKTEIKTSPSSSSTPRNLLSVKEMYPFTPNILNDGQSFLYDSAQPTHDESSEYIDDSIVSQQLENEMAEKIELNPEYQTFLNKFDVLPRTYIDNLIRDREDAYGGRFAVHFDPSKSKFHIGSAEIDFDGNDVIVQGKKYDGTPQLYDLLFKKNPQILLMKPQAMDAFIEIVNAGNLQYLDYDPNKGLSTSNAEKFKNFIKPRVTNLHFLSTENAKNKAAEKALEKLQKESEEKAVKETIALAKQSEVKKSTNFRNRSESGSLMKSSALPTYHFRPRADSGSVPRSVAQSKRGAGISQSKGKPIILMDLNNKHTEYKYFDDFNEIVNRLKLLMASQLAGNTGVNNEIVSVIEELKEAKIIK